VDVQPYLERVLNRGRYQEAEGVWEDLDFNGGFEQAPLNAGFDSRSQPTPYVSIDFAAPSAYEGALRLDFRLPKMIG